MLATSRAFRFTATVLVAGALGAGGMWFATGRDAPKVAALPLWPIVNGMTHSSESIGAPRTLDAVIKKSDAIVVAHVTDVVEGRPSDPGYPEKNLWIKITVDRVVLSPDSAPVKEGDVLNFELGPIPIDQVRGRTESGQQLYFLNNGASRAYPNIWSPVTARGVVAEWDAGRYGLGLPLASSEESDGPFVAAFGARTVAGAADHVAESLR